MARWILIDNASGYIWGDSAGFKGGSFQGTAIEYAKALSESLGGFGRTYEEVARPDNSDETGYHVYRADIDGSEAVPAIENGQDAETIAAVTASCRSEGFIRITLAE
jgi:hypothetical protein